jgi:hypothetical protein
VSATLPTGGRAAAAGHLLAERAAARLARLSGWMAQRWPGAAERFVSRGGVFSHHQQHQQQRQSSRRFQPQPRWDCTKVKSRLNPVDPQLESAWFQPLNLPIENLVSKFALLSNSTRTATPRGDVTVVVHSLTSTDGRHALTSKRPPVSPADVHAYVFLHAGSSPTPVGLVQVESSLPIA